MKRNTSSTTRTNLPQSRVKLTVPVTNAHFKPAFARELAHVAEHTKVEGFRPGKAPHDRVLAVVGRPRVEAGAIDRAVNAAYQEAVAEEKLFPVEVPTITLDSYVAPSEDAADDLVVATFTAEIDVLPEVSVKGYEKIKVKAPKSNPVSEAEVDEVLQYLRKQQAKLEEVAEGTALAKGMWADIKFSGLVDGVAREDMHSEHFPLTVGEGSLIPGFEDELLGLKPGEEKEFEITFPKDYSNKELAAKKATFKVKLHEIKDVTLPSVDDTFATQFGYKTASELEAGIRKSLETQREQEERTKLEELAVEELLKVAKFEVPASLVKQEEERLRGEIRHQLEHQHAGHGHEITIPAELEQQVTEQAPKNVRVGLALGKIIELEKIEDREQAMRKAVDRLLEIATR